MPIHSRHVAVSVLIGLGVAIGSCSSPAGPNLPPPSPLLLTSSLALVVPPEIEPGAQVQLIANGTRTDGSIANISSQVQWRVNNSAIVQVNATGLATAKTHGETIISATFDRLHASASVFVLPKGTFALRGTIKDSGFGVDNAFVTVISGVGTGLTMMTRFGGSFALYGVAGPVEIEVRKDGYRTSVRQLDVSAHGTRDFDLETERARPDFTGTYALTISAASCQTQRGVLPDDAKRRVYTASIAQDAGRLTVTLSDADLIVTNGYGNRFFGFADPDGSITFPIGYGDLYYNDYLGHFDIVERYSTTAFMAGGTVIATGTPQRFSGMLNGRLAISSRASAPFVPVTAECYAKTHGFEMVRR